MIPYGSPPPMDRTDMRNGLWAIAVAGGYASIGDARGGSGSRRGFTNWRTGDWTYDGTLYNDTKNFIKFWIDNKVPYWQMKEYNNLVSGNRVYALANPGKEYVIYAAAGGEFALNLTGVDNLFTVIQFNPRTGDQKKMDDISGGDNHLFVAPDNNDWVYYLKVK